MPARIAADEINGLQSVALQAGPGSGTARKLQCPLLADGPSGFEQPSRDVLGNDPLLVFPALDVRARNGGLQVAAMMMLGIPRASGLMEAADPEHRLRNELETELQAFEVSLVRRYVEFSEDPELML